jgi:hypothetical protein
VGYKLVSKNKEQSKQANNTPQIQGQCGTFTCLSVVLYASPTGHSYLSTNIISYEAPIPENIGGEVVL